MRYKFFQYPRGVNKGGILNTEICPTISTSSWENNCFLIEIEECDSKENILTPTKVSTGTQHKSSSEDNLGGGISRTVKTDDSLAVMEDSNKDRCIQVGNIYPDTDGFKNRTSGRVYSAEGLSPTLRTVTGGHNEPKVVEQKQPRYRIRKLTPRECFRLMGCDEETIDTIQAAGISNSQQYKLAGNSIVVDVLYHLFRKMFVETENESQQLTLF